MISITTHVLDTSTGKPASGIAVVLEHKTNATGWHVIGQAVTDTDGRIKDFGPADDGFNAGHYRLIFETMQYFHMREVECFFPQITIAFVINDTEQHYHVPLLLSSFGYNTYRGS